MRTEAGGRPGGGTAAGGGADRRATEEGVVRRRVGLWLGLALFLAVLLLPAPAGMPAEAWRTTAVALLMAAWWIAEAIPIPATALLPLGLFPLLGVLPIDAAAAPYANPVIFLFMGGFMLALAMQRWGLHRRVALSLVRLVGTRPVNLIAGFMLAAALLSMWVSNTATTIMMLPVGLSVIGLVEARPADDAAAGPDADHNFAVALMLGIAYAASIGGLGTLIGTPPNALLAGFMLETYDVTIGFAQWMLVGVPLAAVSLPLAWIVLTRWVYPIRIRPTATGRAAVRDQLRSLRPPSRAEITVGALFGLTALAWITRPLLERWVPGLSDAGIAIAAAILLFLLPADRRGERLLDWEWARKLPWGVLVLFGGGLSLAGAITGSGLAAWIGASMAGLAVLPVLGIVLIVTASIVFITELTSNTASAAAFLPVLAALAIGIGHDPMLLAVPAALAASCAFMLPVATPPNAIVFGSGHVTIPQMARAGIWLNLVMIGLITLAGYALVVLVFGAGAGSS